ncbi:MAG: glycoside hydrolase family 31 protein [Fimbriimonas sp.]|nr:glycoside hydrolase family 31 protein [Fimbriimonas sp.]
MKTPLAIGALLLTTTALAGASSLTTVLRERDGIRVTMPNGVLWLQALTPGSFRVRFSPSGTFRAQRVPTVVTNGTSPLIRLIVNQHKAAIATDEATATADLSTGTVSFASHDGRQFLSEGTGARRLSPITLDGPVKVASYRAEQRFTISRDEGIYGLGQHQDGFLDYRGTTVHLEQQNKEIAIPYIVSSRGYGLLWNNPAYTTVGVAATEGSVPASQLLDDEGIPGGLTGHYYVGEHFETLAAKRKDSQFAFDWTPAPPIGLPHDHYSVRWTGWIQAKEAGSYVFKTTSDDGVRLWVDDKQVIDNWTVHPPFLNIGKLRFKAGTRHSIRLEYFQAAGGAALQFGCGIEKPSNTLRWTSDASDGIDYLVFYGPSLDKVTTEYRQATGQAPLIPKWALGYWQSKERYNSQQDWNDVAREYRARKHPIDNIVQDWFYWDPAPWGSHKLDPNRYPNPRQGISDLHDRFHVHFMISVWGKFNPGNASNPDANYEAMKLHEYLYPARVSGDRYYDAFNPGARRLYWEQLRDELFDFGVDAWWLDASEPELDMNGFRSVQTAAGLGAQVLNGWPLLHTTGVSDGQLRSAPNKRTFILTRSAYAGQQRTGAACWSGDIDATWQVYANQIPAGLNFCLSGIPYWTTDIGAFFVSHQTYPSGPSDPKFRELFTRWFQYGAFCPIFRVHGTDFPKEMWRFGPETEKILNDYDELRYRLMPYIYSQAWQVTAHGGTLMRALVMDFPNDAMARECKDEFLFGPSLLICPVIQPGARSRSVYLPAEGDWYDFWTGRSYSGGRTIIAAAPIERMPIFVRGGSILPLGPVMQYIDEAHPDPIELRIYPGRHGAIDLYEDNGSDNAYRLGKRAIIPISWEDRAKTLTIGKRHGAFAEMLQKRTFEVSLIGRTPRTKTLVYAGANIRTGL